MSEKKYFIYTRKSTDTEDRQVRSLADQLSELRELARKEQLEVVDTFIEKQTAKVPGRPVFAEMIECIEKGEASGILAWHPDRLARNSVDGGRVIYLVDTGKITDLKFPTFWFDSTPQGKFMLSIAFHRANTISTTYPKCQTRLSSEIEKWHMAAESAARIFERQENKRH